MIKRWPFLRDTKVQGAIMVSLVLLLIALISSYRSLRMADHLLIVHFDRFHGIDVLGTREDVFGIIFSGWGIAFINVILGYALYFRERFFSYLILFSNVCLATLLLIATIVILSVN